MYNRQSDNDLLLNLIIAHEMCLNSRAATIMRLVVRLVVGGRMCCGICDYTIIT